MRKNRLTGLLKAMAFCALLTGALALTSRVVERKASVNRLKPFLDQPQEYDVLFVGDSHMVNGVFPMELWHDYGITAYNIACIGNTLPVSYWTLMNALDAASPRLVVIGVKDVEKSYKLSGSSSDVHTAMDGFPLTLTKIRAIEDLMSDPDAVDDSGDHYAGLKWEYYFKLAKYHGRWRELTRADFAVEPNRQMGAEMAVAVAEPNDYDIIDEDWALEESGWGFAYLRQMIEVCQSRDIGVLLVHLPYPATQEEQMAANTVGYIAQEYGVDYIDFVNLDQVVDYGTDCYDSFSHLNPSGARKVTDYLGRYITGHYAVEDHRGEAHYAGWEEQYGQYTAYKLAHIRGQQLQNVLMLLHDPAFSTCVMVREGSPLYEDGTLLRLLQNIAREHVYEEDAYSKWSNALFPLAQLDEAALQREAYCLLVDRGRGDLHECAGDEAELEAETSFGRVSYCAQEGGTSLRLAREDGTSLTLQAQADVTILVIDDRTGEPAAQLAFDL